MRFFPFLPVHATLAISLSTPFNHRFLPHPVSKPQLPPPNELYLRLTLPQVAQIHGGTVTGNESLKLWTGKHLQPIMAYDRLEAPYEGCRLFPDLDTHAVVCHQMHVTDPVCE